MGDERRSVVDSKTVRTAGIVEWYPPEEAPKDRAFLITTAGPGMDIAFWDKGAECFRDYYHKQRITMRWPYVVGWAEMPIPAVVGNTIDESRAANGFLFDKK